MVSYSKIFTTNVGLFTIKIKKECDMKKVILIFCIAFSVIAHSPSAEANDSRWLVSPQWLNEHMNDDNLIVVDVSLRYQDYLKEHIPNSVYVDSLVDLADKNEKIHYEMVLKEDFEVFMRRIGAQQDSTLVFYDNFQNRLAIRALFVTDYYGHENTAVLDGGYISWKLAGLPVDSDIPNIKASNYTVGEIHPELVVDKQYVKGNLYNPDVIFVDSRPWEMYTGQAVDIMVNTGKEVARRGRLPGAISLPWKKSLNAQNRFHDADTLMAMFDEHGLKKETDTIVFYCNEGVHAVFNWFVATKILGFSNAKVYEGSMGEWAEDPLLPLVSAEDVRQAVQSYIENTFCDASGHCYVYGVKIKFDHLDSNILEKDGFFVSSAFFIDSNDVYVLDFYVRNLGGAFSVEKVLFQKRNEQTMNVIIWDKSGKKGSSY